jgi:uncharacterized membrane protein YkoI
MTESRILLAAAVVLAGTASQLAAQAPKVKEEKPGLLAQAKVTSDSAQRLALAKVPGGKIAKAEIEEEDGMLIYSFDVKVGDKPGVEEVHVDAKTGAVVSVEHEGGEYKAKKPPA